MPTEDPAALIAEARAWTKLCPCPECQTTKSLIARLATALERVVERHEQNKADAANVLADLAAAQADAAAQRARVGELERQLAIHRETELDLIRVALTPPVPRHD